MVLGLPSMHEVLLWSHRNGNNANLKFKLYINRLIHNNNLPTTWLLGFKQLARPTLIGLPCTKLVSCVLSGLGRTAMSDPTILSQKALQQASEWGQDQETKAK